MNAANRQYTRWLTLLGTIITQFALGSVYTWSLFNSSLSTKLDEPVSQVAFSFGLLSLGLALSSSVAGKLQERFGVKRVTMASGILLGLGFFQLFQKQGQAGVLPHAPIVILLPFVNLPIQVIKRNSLALGQNLVQLIQLQNQTHLTVDGAVLLGLRQRSAALAQCPSSGGRPTARRATARRLRSETSDMSSSLTMERSISSLMRCAWRSAYSVLRST